MTTEDDISVIGTGSDELCSGREPIREPFLRNFEEATASRFEWHWTRTAVRGDTAVIASTITIHLEFEGRRVTVPCAGRWRWPTPEVGGSGCIVLHPR